MRVIARRLAAVATLLMLSVGNLAACSGWLATPEARMACCKNGTSCPMHKSAARAMASTQVVSQAQADSCCAAASNRTESSSALSTFTLSAASALPAIVSPIVAPQTIALERWRALVPLPASPVPKHLLLSVFLV